MVRAMASHIEINSNKLNHYYLLLWKPNATENIFIAFYTQTHREKTLRLRRCKRTMEKQSGKKCSTQWKWRKLFYWNCFAWNCYTSISAAEQVVVNMNRATFQGTDSIYWTYFKSKMSTAVSMNFRRNALYTSFDTFAFADLHIAVTRQMWNVN